MEGRNIFTVIYSVITLGLSAVQLGWFCSCFLVKRFSKSYVLYMLWSAAWLPYRVILNQIKNPSAVLTMLCGAVYFGVIVGNICYRENWKKILGVTVGGTVLMVSSAVIVLLYVKGLSGLDQSVVGNNDFDQFYTKNTILAGMLQLSFYMLAIFIHKKVVQKNRMRIVYIILLSPLYQTILMGVYYYAIQKYNMGVAFFGMVLYVFSILVNFYLVDRIEAYILKVALEKELSEVYYQRGVEQQYHTKILETTEQMQRMKDDFENQLKMVYAMIENQEEEIQIRRLLDVAGEDLRSISLKKFCEHPVINTVLVVKEDLAKQKGIRIHIAADVAADLQVERMDLCSMLCNLLDNAIEACERIKDENLVKEMKVKIATKAGYLIIKVENSKENVLVPKGKGWATSKLSANEHGYGTKLIAQLAQKYDGTVNWNVREKSICVVATMRNTTCEV